MELEQANKIALSITDLIRGCTSRAEVAGSIRRLKPNVKDVEIVAIVTDYDALYKALAPAGRFIKPGVPDIIDWAPKSGAKYVRMLLNEGIKLDLFVAHSENWGGIFTMRTGSGVGPDGEVMSGFVPRMFSRWKKVSKGGRMVGGQPVMPDGLVLSVPEEEDFFELCNMQWVPPQDRASASAIKAIK